MNDKKTILLVEDEAGIALIEKTQLRKYGYDVITASDANEAINTVFGNDNIDCILMDINLGDGIDGTEAAEIILQERDIPVIFVSSHTEPEIVELTEKITSYGYVVKNTGITILDASIKMAFRLFNAKREIQDKKQELDTANEELLNAIKKLEMVNMQLQQSEKELRIREKEITKNEERYRLLLEYLPVGVFRLYLSDPEKLVDANPALGLLNNDTSADHIMQRPVSSFFEAPGQMYTLVSLLQRNGVIRNRLTRLKRTDGSLLWGLITAACHYDDMGNPVWIQGVVEDVTDKIDLEEELSSQLVFLETLIDTISSPVYYKNTDGLYLGCNRMFAEKIIGLPREQIIHKSILDIPGLMPDNLMLKHIKKDNELLAEPGIQIYDAHVKCADGETRFFQFSKSTFTATDGSVAGIVGIMVDITERIKNEHELRRANEELNLLITSISSILIGVSVKDRITHWNPCAEHVLGIKAGDVINKQFCECPINWDWGIIYESIMKSIIDDSVIYVDDLYFTVPDGRTGSLGIKINPVKRNDDILEGFLIMGKELSCGK